jgi:N-sulfoglucosamine sulfohydrolase
MPNLLYIHSHDTGRYLQPYGHAIPTPNLQRLAEQGVLFRRAFCAAPTCSPSRAALLTGQWAHSSGMLGLAHRGFTLNDPNQLLSNVLKRAGYATALAGVQHVVRGSETDRLGYDTILPRASLHAADVAPPAVEWLRARRGSRQPFFLDVGFYDTHRDFPPIGAGDDPRYVMPPAPLPDTPGTRADMAAYRTMARQLDNGVGAVLAALDDAGLANDTLVISTTDHGIAFPGMKCNLTDHGIGVSLIVRGPARSGFAGGKVVDAMVSHVDVFPTICDVLGVAPPPWLQGRSITPLVRDGATSIRDELVAEVTYHAAYEPKRAVRTERWKYVRNYDGRASCVLPNCDDSPSKSTWLDAGWRDRPRAGEELYDLAFDPNEACNVAGEPGSRGVLDQMRARLDRWMRETNDPLLRGPVPLPPGAVVNDPDGLSPNETPRADART